MCYATFVSYKSARVKGNLHYALYVPSGYMLRLCLTSLPEYRETYTMLCKCQAGKCYVCVFQVCPRKGKPTLCSVSANWVYATFVSYKSA